MTELETAIRTAARSGRLNHLSLAFMNGKWSASYRGVSDPDKRIVDHADPVAAMVAALTGKRPVAPPKAKTKPVDDEDDLL